MSEANIAVVTQQASDMSFFVTMIDMKIAAAARFRRAANAALAFLSGKKSIIFSKRDSISRAQFVILRKSWIGFAPFLGVLGRSLSIFCQPRRMTRSTADFAFGLQTIKSSGVGIKFAARFNSLALTASLLYAGVRSCFGHVSLLMSETLYSKLYRLASPFCPSPAGCRKG